MNGAASPRGRWLIGVVLLGAALRIGYGLATLYPVEAMTLGDAWSFWTQAKNLLAHGVLTNDLQSGPQFFRPPLYVLYLAALMRVIGATPWAVMSVTSLLSASGSVFCARIAQVCWPRKTWLPLTSALLYALDPIQIAFPGTLLSEGLAAPMVLGFVCLLLGALREPGGWLPFAAGGVGGVLANLRVDLLALSLGAFVLAAWLYWRRGRARPWRPWLAASAVTLLLCLPWSVYASAHLGQPTVLAKVPSAGGLEFYSTTLRLSLNDWQTCEHGYMFGRVSPQLIPSRAFSGPHEEAQVRGLLEQVQRHGRPPLQVDDRLRALARERIASGRLRYYVGLTLWRSLQLWLHYEKGTNRIYAEGERGVTGATPDLFAPGAGLLGSLWRLPYAVLCLLGFLCAWAVLARSRGPRSLLAALILLRTYSVLGAGLFAGRAAFEVRYMTVVQPLALIVALGVVSSLWRATPRASARP